MLFYQTYFTGNKKIRPQCSFIQHILQVTVQNTTSMFCYSTYFTGWNTKYDLNFLLFNIFYRLKNKIRPQCSSIQHILQVNEQNTTSMFFYSTYFKGYRTNYDLNVLLSNILHRLTNEIRTQCSSIQNILQVNEQNTTSMFFYPTYFTG